MKKLTIILILLLIATSAFAGFYEIKKYFADYKIYTGIKPVMSEDGLSVTGWVTSVKIKTATRFMDLWTPAETNILNYDLTEPDTHTKSEFLITSETWQAAQQVMFVNAYKIAQKLNTDPTILPEIIFSSIDFVNTDNVKLIDTTTGALPTGEMIPKPVLPPGDFETLSPANAATVSSSPVTLTWTPSARATSYKIEYYNEYSGTHSFATTTATSYQLAVTVGSTNKWYYWKVTAINEDGETEAWATPYFVTHQ